MQSMLGGLIPELKEVSPWLQFYQAVLRNAEDSFATGSTNQCILHCHLNEISCRSLIGMAYDDTDWETRPFLISLFLCFGPTSSKTLKCARTY